MTSLLILLTFSVFVSRVQCQVGATTSISGLDNADPVPGQFSMHTSYFTTITGERPNFITNYMGDLIVCTFTKIYRINLSSKVPELLLDVQAAVASLGGGRALHTGNGAHGGVRSVAFHPKKTRFFYVSMMEVRSGATANLQYLTNQGNSAFDSVVAEFKLNKARTNVQSNSYRSVLRIGVPFANANSYDHPIKTIAFKGKVLYIAHGDAADQIATGGGGQNGNDAFGKILRIKPLFKKRTGESYTIPKGNPFVNDPFTLSEIYALGFRNPHHICFGDGKELFVGETGRNTVEEVNIVNKGENYGWANREGWFKFESGVGSISNIPDNDPEDAFKKYTYPAAAYGHNPAFGGQAMGGSCPVTNQSPMKGIYMFFDFPVQAHLYYSYVSDLLSAKTKGPFSTLTRATVYQFNICYHTNSGQTISVDTLKGIIDIDGGGSRADVRMGRGPNGVMYWSSKTNGNIYKVDSSEPGGDTSSC